MTYIKKQKIRHALVDPVKMVLILDGRLRELGISRKEFADQLQLDHNLVNKWFLGDYNFKEDQLQLIQEVLKFRIADYNPTSYDVKVNMYGNFDHWKFEVNRLIANSAGTHPELSDTILRKWYSDGYSPYQTFQQTNKK